MSRQNSQWRRWGVFNVVGVLGFAIQLLTLFLLKRVIGLDYRLATACAVEIAVLHNFAGHEHLTWSDVASRSRSETWTRLLRFHAANGIISLIGNVAFTWAMVVWAKIPYLLANAASVLICSVLNFVAGDRFVFRSRDKRGIVDAVRTGGDLKSKRTFVQDREEFSGD